MARRRMIDPNFWSSPDVSRLSHFERLVLIGLISNADDYGKGFSAPIYVRSTIFPYEDIPAKRIATALENIQACCEITIYDVNGGQFYKFNNWGKWQSVDKPNKSKIPEPFSTDSLLIPDPFATDSDPKRKEKKRKENNSEDEKITGEFFANDSVNDSFIEFLRMRKTIRKPATVGAIKLLIKTLGELSQNPETQKRILEQSIMNSWQGLFPLKNEPKEKDHGYENWSGTGRDRDTPG